MAQTVMKKQINALEIRIEGNLLDLSEQIRGRRIMINFTGKRGTEKVEENMESHMDREIQGTATTN